MNNFSRIHAATAFAFDYKVEYLGETVEIAQLHNNYILYRMKEPDFNLRQPLDTIPFSAFDNGTAKIICRPLTDLTKEITENGKTFVPIVELAKIQLDFNWKLMGQIVYLGVLSFWFDGLDFKFQNHSTQDWIPVIFQLELFDQLKSWHFPIGFSPDHVTYKP